MTFVERMEEMSRIDEEAFDSFSDILFHSVSLNRQYKNHSSLIKKEELVGELISFLNKYLALKVTASTRDKAQILTLIHKLTMQKELIEIQSGKLNIADIKAAAKRMGKKSQSAFGGK
ncbi:MAG: hypothetical protein V4649_03600 [Bacteroidota bacterium]